MFILIGIGLFVVGFICGVAFMIWWVRVLRDVWEIFAGFVDGK